MRRTSVLILVLSAVMTAQFGCSNAQSATQAYEDGLRLQKERKNVEAVARFNEAVRLKPDYALAYFELGQSLQSLGRYADAIAAYDSAIRIDPLMSGAYIKRGYAKDALNSGSGLADLNDGVRLSPLAIPGVRPPLLITGMPGLTPHSGGSQAAAILKQSTEDAATTPSRFDAYLQELLKSTSKPEKPKETLPDHFWHQFDESSRRVSPGSPLFPPSERRQVTDDIFHWTLPAPSAAPPAQPRAADAESSSPDNKAYFFLADTGEQSTRASVDEATRLFNITTYPTVIVTKLVPPMQGKPTAANLDIQVRCEGQPLPACTQQLLDWFGEN